MKKIVQVTLAAVCLMGAGAAHAQFGGLSALGGIVNAKKGNAGGDISADVGTFVSQSAALSLLASRSVMAINDAFLSDEERVKKNAQLEAINKMTNTGEQNASNAKLYESEAAELKRRLESGEMKERMATLNDAKKKQVATALMNFGIGTLQALALTQTGKSLMVKISADPFSLPKLIPVKDSLPILGKVATDAGGFMLGVTQVVKGANIEVPAVKADSKPAEINFG